MFVKLSYEAGMLSETGISLFMNGMKYDRKTSYRIDEMEPEPGGPAMIRTAYFRYSEHQTSGC